MGSPTGMWTAVSGAMAQSQNVDTIANNIANVNTTGFKKDTPTFKEYLAAEQRTQDPINDVPRTIFKDSDFYHTEGREHAMVNVNRIVTEHSQGNLKPTNGPFDLAIDGSGFFAVKTPSGLMYTRSGDFKVNAAGFLVTNDGYPVLAVGEEAGAAPAAAGAAPGATDADRNPASVNPFTQTEQVMKLKPDPNNPNAPKAPLADINLAERISQGQKINITREGEIYAGNEKLAKLAIAEFTDAKLLEKKTSTLYANANGANIPRLGTESNVQQGFLEMSNVSPVSELMNLLKANRMFESNMKAIRTYNEMSGKEANEVGKL